VSYSVIQLVGIRTWIFRGSVHFSAYHISKQLIPISIHRNHWFSFSFLALLVGFSSLGQNTWQNNLREEGFILAHRFRPLTGSIAFMPVAKQKHHGGRTWGGKLLTSWSTGTREKRPRTRFTFQKHTPRHSLPPVRPTFHSFYHVPIIHSIMN
jgi:hypothetical protein